MQARFFYLCVVIISSLTSIIPIFRGVLSQDTGCVSADSLLGGRRRIVSAAFRASNSRSGNRASQARLSGDGWCSRQLATDIFDPYIEIDFGGDVLFSSITTQGVPPNTAEALLLLGNRFIERYRVEVTKEDGSLQYVTPSASIFQPAIFPLRQSRISSTNRHRESLPRPVIGQTLRINPYEWNDEDYVCTRLEVYGCPLQECQSESQLNSDRYVDSVTVNGSPIDADSLFNFGNAGRYCGPTDMKPFTINIAYSSPVLLREIDIQGSNQILGPSPLFESYVTSFSLSFSEDDGNFTEYIRDTGSTEFTASDELRRYFALWPPITASSIQITINNWNIRPCMSFLMLGCNYSDVVDHSISTNNGTATSIDSGLVDDMTMVLTTTESITTTETIIQATTENYTFTATQSFMVTTTESVTTTETIVQTTTESFTVTVKADLTGTPSPSPTQSSNTAASTSCSSDNDNIPIYVAVAIVIVGLIITLVIVIVGIILCRLYQKSDESRTPLHIKYKTTRNDDSPRASIIEVDNAMYGKTQPQSHEQSRDDKHTEIIFYDHHSSASKKESGVVETADNPQYGEVIRRSNSRADSKTDEKIYSYAIP